jgi:hypothetical protein
MPRVCSICSHPEKPAINAALVESQPFRLIAERYGTSAAALTRHKADHLPATLAKATEAKETALGDDLLGQVKQLRNKAISILLKAEQGGDYRTALMGIREARGCLELLAEMEGELNRTPQVNLYLAPEWLAVRGRLLVALGDFPEARAAAALALQQVDYGNG